jgi:hypothetical protein
VSETRTVHLPERGPDEFTFVVTATDWVVRLDGVLCRVFVGKNLCGAECELYVHRIATEDEAFQRVCDRALWATPVPEIKPERGA